MQTNYSVLMSVYINEIPEYFIQSLESMVKQTIIPNEIVIVKDGMLTNELNEVIKRYESEYPNIFNIIPLKKNIGLGRALDVGLEHCKNELVARMDSDDISLPKRCESQLKVFNVNPDLVILGTMIDEFYDTADNIVSSRVVPTTNKEIHQFMKRRSPFNHPTVMYKKSEVIRCGGYGKMRRKQDLDLFSRMINNGCNAQNINKSLLLFRSNEDNFKRRKSWSYCKSYIDVQYEIWKRGHCSVRDLIFVTAGQIFMFVAPMSITKKISKRYLRKN